MPPAAAGRSPLLIIFIVVFLDLLGFGIVIPILPYYAEAYGANGLTLGWLLAIYSAMQLVFAPVWGRLSDAHGRRPILVATILGQGASLLVLGFAPSLAWLFVGRALAGICGANLSTAAAYIADVTPEEGRARGMGVIGAGFGLGFIFGPAIGGLLSHWGYGTPMFVAAGVALAAGRPQRRAEPRVENIRIPFEVDRIDALVAYHDLQLESGSLNDEARQLAEQVRQALEPFCLRPVPELPDEEAYTVFCVEAPLLDSEGQAVSAESWLRAHRREVAALLTQETDIGQLSRQEAEESTGRFLSYYRNDLVVIDWDAALILDEPADFDETLYVMELANLQLA